MYIQTSCLQRDFTDDDCSEIHPMLTSQLSTPPPSPHLRFISLAGNGAETPQQGKPGGSTRLMHPINPREYTKHCPALGPSLCTHPHLRSLANHRAGWAGRAQCLWVPLFPRAIPASPPVAGGPLARTPGPEYPASSLPPGEALPGAPGTSEILDPR